MHPTLTTEQPQSTSATSFALFDHGSRVFFLLATLYGALAMVFWIPIFVGLVVLPTTASSTLWHAHEMIYGFGAAGIAAFFLTAVPRWTGTPAAHGPSLTALAAIWLLGRVAMLAIGGIMPWLAALADLMFLPAIALAVQGPLRTAGASRNLGLFAVLATLWLADLAMHAEFAGWAVNSAARGARVGIDVLLIVTVIGARIVPAFTSDPTRADAAPAARSFLLLDRATVVAMALLSVSDAATGLSAMTGIVASVAALLGAMRLGFWRALDSPIPWILNIGYCWLALGLALRAAAELGGAVLDVPALHALTAGAIPTMLIAVISRAALGRAVQPVKAHRATIAACALISLAAALRVVAPFIPVGFEQLLVASGMSWTVAFLILLAVYAPILLTSHSDGQSG